MATTSEHYERARAAMSASSNQARTLSVTELDRMIAAAREHLVGWLSEELAAETGTMRVEIDTHSHAAALSLTTDLIDATAQDQHLPLLVVWHRISDVDMLAGSVLLRHDRIVEAEARCAACSTPMRHLSDGQCDHSTLAELRGLIGMVDAHATE